MANIKSHFDLFQGINLKGLLDNPDFKEDSVREVVINPILTRLGYTPEQIIRSKKLDHPFLKVGSKRKPITMFPDYSIRIEDNYAWVLDAKNPWESVSSYDNVEQTYSYAVHPEIRSLYYAVCNGREFALYRTSNPNESVLYFTISEISHHWEQLINLLGPDRFQKGKVITYETTNATSNPTEFNYLTRPLLEEIPVKKQQAKRHFGVHGYFTKQAWNVVNEYIQNYSQPGDLVLDPFGGSGVTAIEALVLGRKAVHIDINPLANFIVQALIEPVDLNNFSESYRKVREQYEKLEPNTEAEIAKTLQKYPYPKNVALPRGSDVKFVHELFTTAQLAKLALLKHIITQEKDKGIKNTLLLMFSGLINKINLTYHASKGRSEGRGNSAMFAYYRYRVAKSPGYIDILTYLDSRFKKVYNAKKELLIKIHHDTFDNIKVVKGSATNLSFLKKETVDYIYTDPPYGKKIAYLDLSVMWTSWLDLDVNQEDYKLEAIVGGEQKKKKEEYNSLIAQSIIEMYRVLKFDRWMSFVFAHKDPEFWHLIIESAQNCGFEYVGAVPQKNGQSSFKKRQHPFTVLSGQLIINFKKVKNPKTILQANLGMNIAEIISQTIEGIVAKNNGATLEQINDELIIKGLELGFLHMLKKEYSDLTPLLMSDFDYDEDNKKYVLPKNTKFKTHIDVRLRIRYYLLSQLIAAERDKKFPTFDEIVRVTMPLLRNGITPENQTILNVLKDIGEHIGEDRWRLKKTGQQKLFLFE